MARARSSTSPANQLACAAVSSNLALRCYSYEAAFADVYACELETELATRGRTLDLVERPGDHPFADYAANGSVSEAFEFVLERLRDC